MEKRPFSHQIAIVTGAAHGIGRGIALSLAQNGALLVLADKDVAGSHDVARQIELSGGKAIVVPTDTENATENQHLVDTTLEHFGRIDLLVNTVGIGIHEQSGLRGMTREVGVHVIQTNLIEPLFLTKRVVEEMIARQIRGNIIFISSIHAHVPYLDPVYTSTKAALEMLVRDTALDVAEHGIRVNAVAPGAILNRTITKQAHAFVPLGYRGTPEDIGNAVVFLASEYARYITGQTLIVDGGLSLVHEAYLDRKGMLK